MCKVKKLVAPVASWHAAHSAKERGMPKIAASYASANGYSQHHVGSIIKQFTNYVDAASFLKTLMA